MKFGKLFKKFMAQFPDVELSANRLSLLSYAELRMMAKCLYPTNKDIIVSGYMRVSADILRKMLFKALSK